MTHLRIIQIKKTDYPDGAPAARNSCDSFSKAVIKNKQNFILKNIFMSSVFLHQDKIFSRFSFSRSQAPAWERTCRGSPSFPFSRSHAPAWERPRTPKPLLRAVSPYEKPGLGNENEKKFCRILEAKIMPGHRILPIIYFLCVITDNCCRVHLGIYRKGKRKSGFFYAQKWVKKPTVNIFGRLQIIFFRKVG